jgi:hypothetical protein
MKTDSGAVYRGECESRSARNSEAGPISPRPPARTGLGSWRLPYFDIIAGADRRHVALAMMGPMPGHCHQTLAGRVPLRQLVISADEPSLPCDPPARFLVGVGSPSWNQALFLAMDAIGLLDGCSVSHSPRPSIPRGRAGAGRTFPEILRP